MAFVALEIVRQCICPILFLGACIAFATPNVWLRGGLYPVPVSEANDLNQLLGFVRWDISLLKLW